MKFTLLTTTVLAYTTALVSAYECNVGQRYCGRRFPDTCEYSFYRGGAIMLVNALGPRAGDAGQYLFDCVQGGSSKVLKIVNNCGANNCIIPGSNQNDYCAPSKDSGEE